MAAGRITAPAGVAGVYVVGLRRALARREPGPAPAVDPARAIRQLARMLRRIDRRQQAVRRRSIGSRALAGGVGGVVSGGRDSGLNPVVDKKQEGKAW